MKVSLGFKTLEMVEETIDVASCSSPPKPPNRDSFEKSLSELNDQISVVEEKVFCVHLVLKPQ